MKWEMSAVPFEDKQLRIAVCDDHTEARNHIRKLLEKYMDANEHLVRIDEFCCAEDFLAAKVEGYALVLMDIYMDQVSGMDAARQMYENNPGTKIIFCSSSAEFGVESYEVDAFGYLLKPAKEEQLFKLLDRFFRIYTKLKTITVKVDRIDETIYINDILWVEASRNNCIIHTRSRDYVTRVPFSQLCEKFPASEFVKPIRYALVSLRAVATIPAETVKLADGTQIPVARDARATVKKAYLDHQWKSMMEKAGGR